MIENDTNQYPYFQTKVASRTAIERGDNIQEEVRNITLKALTEQQLDEGKIKHIIKAVIQGASEGADGNEAQVKQALKDVLIGVDEALVKSTEASKLAIEEAASHLNDFSSHDLKRALEDLAALEGLFIESINEVADASKETIKITLTDIISHIKNSGTEVGKLAADTVENLTKELRHTLSDAVSAGGEAVINKSAQLSLVAAGFLEGIADSLVSKK